MPRCEGGVSQIPFCQTPPVTTGVLVTSALPDFSYTGMRRVQAVDALQDTDGLIFKDLCFLLLKLQEKWFLNVNSHKL